MLIFLILCNFLIKRSVKITFPTAIEISFFTTKAHYRDVTSASCEYDSGRH